MGNNCCAVEDQTNKEVDISLSKFYPESIF